MRTTKKLLKPNPIVGPDLIVVVPAEFTASRDELEGEEGNVWEPGDTVLESYTQADIATQQTNKQDLKPRHLRS